MDSSDFCKMIGKNIRKLREAHNMSLYELSEIIELSASYLGLIERGERALKGLGIYDLYIISKLFGVKVNDLCNENFEYSSTKEDELVRLLGVTDEKDIRELRKLMLYAKHMNPKGVPIFIETAEFIASISNPL